jgi:hypothetical protein
MLGLVYMKMNKKNNSENLDLIDHKLYEYPGLHT